MIKKFKFGYPVETDAVIEQVEITSGEVPYFTQKKIECDDCEDSICFTFCMGCDDMAFGLGEANRGINKRGYKYVSYCADDPSHTEEKVSLYGAHNFIVIDGEKRFGVFIDNPGKVIFDIGYEKINELSITAKYPDMYVYIIEGDSIIDIVSQFRKIIGKSYIAPEWAFGFQQSRWSYENEDEVREIVAGYEKCNIPLSAIYMDIDYMIKYEDFTVDEEKFPEFPKFVKELKDKGIHLVPIIDAGVKIEDGYDIYEEGKKNNYFVKDEKGKDYVAAVWPGYTHFPDFLNKETRKWFGSKYKKLIDMGIDGFWNDMNEPAIFYSENEVNKAKDKIKALDVNNISTDELMDIKWHLDSMANNQNDYNSMYHNMNGEKINHDKVHNIYGYNMTRAAGEAFKEMAPDEDILLFSRSSYIGMHRYGGIWMGDNQSWWSHILLNLKMLPSLNMCGFLYTGADLGGFGSNVTRELLLRWLALGVFTPLMRNHAAMGTRLQECFRFENTEDFKAIIDTRYMLKPYLYKLYKDCIENDKMMFRPLAFDYNDDKIAKRVEDQLMLGDYLMIAPVYTENARGRYVYLPEDMTLVKFGPEGIMFTKNMKKGHNYIEVELNEVPLFIKKDGITGGRFIWQMN